MRVHLCSHHVACVACHRISGMMDYIIRADSWFSQPDQIAANCLYHKQFNSGGTVVASFVLTKRVETTDDLHTVQNAKCVLYPLK